MFLTKERYEELTGNSFDGNWFLQYNRSLALFQAHFIRFPFSLIDLDQYEVEQIEKAFIFQIDHQLVNEERDGILGMKVGNFSVDYAKGNSIDSINSISFDILDNLNYRYGDVIFKSNGCDLPWL